MSFFYAPTVSLFSHYLFSPFIDGCFLQSKYSKASLALGIAADTPQPYIPQGGWRGVAAKSPTRRGTPKYQFIFGQPWNYLNVF